MSTDRTGAHSVTSSDSSFAASLAGSVEDAADIESAPSADRPPGADGSRSRSQSLVGTPRAAPISRDRLIELILGELSHVLWQQRDLITDLIYRLDVQRFVLGQGRDRWVEFATDDVDRVLDDVRRQESFRTELIGDLSNITDLSPEVTLRDLISYVGAPWDGIFTEHHAAFLALTAEAEQLSRSNSELLHRSLMDLDDILGSFGDRSGNNRGAQGYENAGRHGAKGTRLSGARLNADTPTGSLLIDRDA